MVRLNGGIGSVSLNCRELPAPFDFSPTMNLLQAQVMIPPPAAKTMVKTTYSMVTVLLHSRMHGVIEITPHAVNQPKVTRPCDRAVKDVQYPFDPCRKTSPCPGPVRVNTPRYFPCACLAHEARSCSPDGEFLLEIQPRIMLILYRNIRKNTLTISNKPL